MGRYLNPGVDRFGKIRKAPICVDQSGLLRETNAVLSTPQKYLCVCRPRRSGKSVAAEMISAYYDRTTDAGPLFADLEIGRDPSFRKGLNHCDVIRLDLREFLQRSGMAAELPDRICCSVLSEILEEYPDCRYFDPTNLTRTMRDLFAARRTRFVIVIDDWDRIFWEYPHEVDAQRRYLDFLRDWLKDKPYVALAYLTGILPIRKYGTHSGLSMFSEYSMVRPGPLARYAGFTREEVRALCERQQMDPKECCARYGGYCLARTDGGTEQLCRPGSVVKAMMQRRFEDYGNDPETGEVLKRVVDREDETLRERLARLMAGERLPVQTDGFPNDLISLAGADDVLTLLIHLGYLAYDADRHETWVPNREALLGLARALE